ncbi:MAG: hypothetical protein A2583_13815 [Bdellovibrionales bacterium RIFOXYD1_FULL_53_11]|nr:MAG: hypothetical protein A2583_13815 [Bdellovibrionales bacterium RIFOXYD1_FULL_53_11]
MSLPFNHVSMTGWLLGKPALDSKGQCTFTIFHHSYHVSFSTAVQNLGDGIIIQVYITHGDNISGSMEYLKRGDRVIVNGELQNYRLPNGKVGQAINAYFVERSEILSSFRYCNHPWHEQNKHAQAPSLRCELLAMDL